MAETSLMYWQEQFGKTQPRVLRLEYNITAAKTVAPLASNSAVLTTFDAIATQATIDNHLGTSSEFLVAAFDSTAMGNDTFGGVVNMAGQAKKLLMMVATCYSASNTVVTRQCQVSTTLTASTLTTECALGASGNVAFKVDFGNTPDFDGLTAGTIVVELHWISK
jgi:hypothetical protein